MITSHLPADVDKILEDVVQIYGGGITYEEIRKFKPTRKDILVIRGAYVDLTHTDDEYGPEFKEDLNRIVRRVKDSFIKNSLQEVLTYLQEEKKNFEEWRLDNPKADPKGHIYTHLKRVQEWLDAEEPLFIASLNIHDLAKNLAGLLKPGDCVTIWYHKYQVVESGNTPTNYLLEE
jgi:PHP family Zn ribbon phosphoesterase